MTSKALPVGQVDERFVELRQQTNALVRLASGDLDQLAHSILTIAASALRAEKALILVSARGGELERIWHRGLSAEEASTAESCGSQLRRLPLPGGTSRFTLGAAAVEVAEGLRAAGFGEDLLTTHMLGPSVGLEGLLILSDVEGGEDHDEVDLIVLDVLASVTTGALVSCVQSEQLNELVHKQEESAAAARARSQELQRELLERHRMERELQQAAAFARYNPSPVLRADARGTVVDANPQCGTVFGEDIVGQTIYELFEELRSDQIDGITGTQRYQFEYIIGGATYVFTVRRDISSESLLIYGTEITDRKIAERVLQAQEKRSRLLLDTVQAGLMVVDLENGEVVEANRQAVQLIGGGKPSIIGKHHDHFFSRDDGLDITHPSETADSSPVEAHLKQDDTGEIPILLTATGVDFSGSTFLLLSFVDISNLKRAERIKTAQFKIFQAAVAATNMTGLLSSIHEILYTLTDASNFYIALFDEETGQYSFPYCVDEYDAAGPGPVDLRGSLTEYVRRTARPLLVDDEVLKKLLDEEEIRLVGHPAPIWLGAPLKVGDDVIGVIAVQDYHDPERYTAADMEILSFVSGNVAMAIERLRSQQEHRQLEEKLQKAEKMESLGMLAGGVAHDLNNMLGPLVGYAELMLLKMDQDNPLRKQIERMQHAATDAAEVIQDLLTMARRGRYEMGPLDLNEVVRRYVDSPSFIKLAESRNEVLFEISLDDRADRINGSAPHLSKVVMNLIVNAYDAMPDGGSLQVKTLRRSLTTAYDGCETVEPGDYVVLKVADTGSGIPEEAISKIFEPYYSKKAMGSSGSGIGLAVVYGILKDHGGFYDIRSEIGVGTEFNLYFPLCEVGEEQEGESEELRGGSERLLIVDDVPDVREMGCTMLETLGYEVVTATDGRSAIEYLQENRVDLLILDMIMEPGFDGLDTLRAALEIQPEQRSLIVSGYSATDRVQEALSLGAAGYVKKPFTLQSFGQAVRSALDRQPVGAAPA